MYLWWFFQLHYVDWFWFSGNHDSNTPPFTWLYNSSTVCMSYPHICNTTWPDCYRFGYPTSTQHDISCRNIFVPNIHPACQFMPFHLVNMLQITNITLVILWIQMQIQVKVFLHSKQIWSYRKYVIVCTNANKLPIQSQSFIQMQSIDTPHITN